MGFWGVIGMSVVGGVIAAAAWAWLCGYWHTTLIPLIQSVFYRDTDIQGCWELAYKGAPNDFITEHWNLRQQAHRITGTGQTVTGTGNGSTFTLNGSFRHMILTVTYETSDKRFFDRGCLTVKFREGGKSAQGWCSYYKDPEDGIVSKECTFRRLDTQASQAHKSR